MKPLFASAQRWFALRRPVAGSELPHVSIWQHFWRKKPIAADQPATFVHSVLHESARTAKSRVALEKASALFDLVLEADPVSWTAAWLAGKTAQGLGDHVRAHAFFKHAFELQPKNVDVAREYSLACLQVGRPHEAAHVAQQAAQLCDQNAGLKANVALAHLCAGDCAKAQEAIASALAQSPRDPISLALRGRIAEVQRGLRPVPATPADLEPAVAPAAPPAFALEPNIRPM